jgi:N-acetylmuramoyl-L-alanine amidase CwlA|tara:strand:+ start:130 stop:309 length:180 start_codon:yes stop_codon:yes gene_type:complete
MKDIKNEFYKNHNKIEIPICFYEDDDGNKVFDLEAMAEEFQNELTKVVGVTVMCSVSED